MTILEMLGQSGLLTLLGMCVVFAFIIILIVSMNLLKIVIHALKLDKVEAKPQAKKTAGLAPQSVAKETVQDMKAIVAAIATAVREKESI